MREIMISSDCLDFIERQDKRVSLKFFQIIEVMTEVKVVHSTFVKKLINTSFYELRIKSGNEIRIILFTVSMSTRSADTHIILPPPEYLRTLGDVSRSTQ